MLITEIKFKSSNAEEKDGGLIGWVSLVLNGSIKIDGISLRRTADDRLTLSYPTHRDGAGHQHYYVRPLTDVIRREIEHEVFTAMGIDQGARR